MLQVPVNIGALDLAPLAVFLNQLKQPRQLRPVFPAPVREQDHGLIICRFLVFGGGFKYRQLQVFIEVFLKRRCAGVGPDFNVADHKSDFIFQLCQFRFGLGLLLKHKFPIHQKAVVFHQADVYSGGRFYLFHHIAMLGQIPVKPVVEQVIQAQGIIRIGAGVAEGFGIPRVQFIEIPAGGYRFKAGQLHIKQLRYQCF